jgi:sensor histidine kinase YesM
MRGSSEKFVFSDEWRYRVARHLSFWLAWLVFHGIIYGSFWRGGGSQAFGTTFSEALARSLFISFTEAILFMPAHLFLSYSIIYFLFPRYLFSKKYIKLLAGFVLLLFITAILSHLTATTIIKEFRESIGLSFGSNTLLFGLMAGLRGSNTVAGFAAAIKLIKYWYIKTEENQKLEKEKLNAELQALRTQLHPHFLFNTLNNLYSLTLHQSSKAPQMVIRLSELLRYILTDCNQPLVSLKTELDMLTNYIELEKSRLGDRLHVDVHTKGDVSGYQIAPLLLLPFLENSFKHGVRDQIEPVWVSLHLEVEEGKLTLRLINTKSSLDTSPMKSTGIGLQNIQKRLQLIYPKQHQLKITDTEESFIVNLAVPLELTTVSEDRESPVLETV